MPDPRPRRSLPTDAHPDARAEAEVRQLFERWFDDSARKDLDGAMAPIAADVVAYEHGAPLAKGFDGMRAECEVGFTQAPDDFRWDVPDLHVEVRGDLAVAWGLNRMAGRTPDGIRFESWSRGTRVFERRGERWLLVHQHVSFPMDPATGMAAVDLRPEP